MLLHGAEQVIDHPALSGLNLRREVHARHELETIAFNVED